MDTKSGIAAMPDEDESNQRWLQWANNYPTLRAAGLTCVEIDRERTTCVLDDVPFPPNPNGAINGGMVALAADQVLGILAARAAPTGSYPVTAALSVQFHSPAYPPLTLRARAVPGGRYVTAIEVVIEGTDGRRCTTAMGTMAVPSRRRGQDS